MTTMKPYSLLKQRATTGVGRAGVSGMYGAISGVYGAISGVYGAISGVSGAISGVMVL